MQTNRFRFLNRITTPFICPQSNIEKNQAKIIIDMRHGNMLRATRERGRTHVQVGMHAVLSSRSQAGHSEQKCTLYESIQNGFAGNFLQEFSRGLRISDLWSEKFKTNPSSSRSRQRSLRATSLRVPSRHAPSVFAPSAFAQRPKRTVACAFSVWVHPFRPWKVGARVLRVFTNKEGVVIFAEDHLHARIIAGGPVMGGHPAGPAGPFDIATTAIDPIGSIDRAVEFCAERENF